MRTLAIGLVTSTFAVLHAAAGAATLAADYQLQQTFASSVGTPPALTEVNTGSATGGSFVQANVYGQSQYVYAFSSTDSLSGEGLATATTGVISPSVYSVVIDVQITTASDLLSKIIDFKSRGSDAGMYIAGTEPVFYNATVPIATGITPVSSGTFNELALTRDAAGTVAVYLNGASEFTFDDSTTQLATFSTNTLNLFIDDPNTSLVTTGLTLENPSGQAARVRLFDGALTPVEVAGLVPEPMSLSLLAAGGLILLSRRTARA